VKLIYAAVFALFPLAAPAQTLDSSLLSALCTDDRYEDTADQCSCTIETVLEKYSTTLPQGTDEGLAAIFLATPGDDMAVGSIGSRLGTAEQAILSLPDDDYLDEEPAGGQDTIASRLVTPEPQPVKVTEDADDIATTGPAAKSNPAVVASSVDDATIE
jgi:hypothetical protein